MLAYETYAMALKRRKDNLKAVMASPTLNDSQKYQITKRLVADLDLHIATHDSYLATERIEAAYATNYPGEMIDDLKREKMASERNVTKLRWQAFKLYVFVPLGEVALSERGARVVGQIKHEIIFPLGRFLGRMIGYAFFISFPFEL